MSLCSAVADDQRRCAAAPTGDGWLARGGREVAGAAGAYRVQTLAQRHVSATRTAVVYTAEWLFADLFGALFAGEQIGPRLFLGGGVIVVATLIGG